MIEIKKKSQCCGCYGCTNICPKKCIDMKIDKEGFWYPSVDKNNCIDCNLCEKVCPVIFTPQKDKFSTNAYACKNKNELIRLNSSSGGVFWSLCEYVIKHNGIVFGAAFNERFEVEHMYATTMYECDKFRGSKYVQSKIGQTYVKAKEFLDDGKLVLFSGTQCQIKGLNLFLRKKYDNLISVDVICHGVPSPKVFEIYKKNLSKYYDGQIEDIIFRDKSYGWKNYRYKINFNNGKVESEIFSSNIYSIGFLNDLYLRPSCYKCNSKNFINGSDISLADYWGVQNKHSEYDDDKGVSLILINSIKGQVLLDKISDNIERIKTDLDYAISNNPCIVRPSKYNPNRTKFFNKLTDDNLELLITKYTTPTLIEIFNKKLKIKLWKIKKKLIK